MSVAARAFGSKEELLALLETRSAYTDGFVEGVYLRIDDAAHCVARGKCVRPDFIQGIEEHWMAGGLVKNAVALGGATRRCRRVGWFGKAIRGSQASHRIHQTKPLAT